MSKESEERERFRQEFCEERQKQYDMENGILERMECVE